MRLPAVVVPAILLLAGTFYFLSRAKGNAAHEADIARFDPPAPAADLVADEYDRVVVRTLLESKYLSDAQSNTLVGAAGRRYIRRKLAYAAAKQAVDSGNAAPLGLEPLRREMELARKVCDLAESLGRRNLELGTMAQADWELERRLAFIPSSMTGLAERFDGPGTFTEADLAQMEQAFLETYGKPLPVSTRGESAMHRAMGFDHNGRFDVAVNPSQPEGVWTRRYLTGKHVPFLAFRSAVPGKATGAHIHIGPPSTHRVPGS